MSAMNDATSSSSNHEHPVDDDIYTNVITIQSTPKVVRNATFDTSAEETDGELQFTATRRDETHNDIRDNGSNAIDCHLDNDDDDIVDHRPGSVFRRTSSTRVETLDCSLFSSWEDVASHVFYITTFAIVGTVSRIYIGRFFGLDCIRQEQDDSTRSDFLTPISSQICITSDGKTQRGGAIFIDLPANMIGSFMFGVLSNENHPFGWLRRDHPMQQDTALHVGLRIGLFGCLTTFSSWNTQMVEMMDGTDTIYGPQVGNAIFGYIIGVACAISSCISGTHFFQWLRQLHPSLQSESESLVGVNRQEKQGIASSRYKTRFLVLVLLCVGLVGSFGAADARYGNTMYREFWLASLMAPFGALIRWRLKALNNRPICGQGSQWFPWGTFTANFVAAIICIVTTALKTYIVEPRDITSDWVLPVLGAVNSGFAGSLSTTSSLAHELVVLETLFQSYCYGFTTIICSMLVGVLIYAPIARFG